MPLIEWKDEYSVKVRIFDEHHRKLVDIINELDNAIAENKAEKVLDRIFSKLIEYTQIHFDSEETLLEQNHYPRLAEQKAEHAGFVDTIKHMRQQYKSGEMGLDQKVMGFLKNWLIGHILESDQAYSDFLNKKSIN